MFWGCEPDAHLSKIAQYTDTLLEQTRKVPGLVTARLQKSRFQKGCRATPIVAAVAKQRPVYSRYIRYVTQTPKERSSPKQGSYGNNWEPNQQRVVMCAWQKTTKLRRAHILSVLESSLRKEKLATSKWPALDLEKTAVEASSHYTYRNQNQRHNPRSRVPQRIRKTTGFSTPNTNGTVTAEEQSGCRKFLPRGTPNRVNGGASGVHAPEKDERPTPIFGCIKPD